MSASQLHGSLCQYYSKGVANFRPVAAAAIYKHFGGTGGVVWDMSSGWGGRLLGAYRAGVAEYIGTEPSTKTINGLKKMIEVLHLENQMKITLHRTGSEVFRPRPNSLDLCFTSPPYFSTEEYSDEASQSHIKFPTKEDWVKHFLVKTLQNCFVGLKPGCYCVINIANTSIYPTGEQDTIAAAELVGFRHVETWRFGIFTMTRSQRSSEPLFIFKKPGPTIDRNFGHFRSLPEKRPATLAMLKRAAKLMKAGIDVTTASELSGINQKTLHYLVKNFGK